MYIPGEKVLGFYINAEKCHMSQEISQYAACYEENYRT